jgi:ribosomal protein S18 acetylase RimI-like enzyme
MNIRQGRPEDNESVIKVFDYRNTSDHDYPPITEYDLNIYSVANNILYYVAEEDEIVGFFVAFDMGSWCYLDVLVVKSTVRGSGIGKALINHLRAIANPNWHHIDACVPHNDVNLLNWMTKQGFQGNDKLIWKFKKIV